MGPDIWFLHTERQGYNNTAMCLMGFPCDDQSVIGLLVPSSQLGQDVFHKECITHTVDFVLKT